VEILWTIRAFPVDGWTTKFFFTDRVPQFTQRRLVRALSSVASLDRG